MSKKHTPEIIDAIHAYAVARRKLIQATRNISSANEACRAAQEAEGKAQSDCSEAEAAMLELIGENE